VRILVKFSIFQVRIVFLTIEMFHQKEPRDRFNEMKNVVFSLTKTLKTLSSNQIKSNQIKSNVSEMTSR
jgi:hypothetical protein